MSPAIGPERLLYAVLSVITNKCGEPGQGLSISRLMLSVRRSPTEEAAEDFSIDLVQHLSIRTTAEYLLLSAIVRLPKMTSVMSAARS